MKISFSVSNGLFWLMAWAFVATTITVACQRKLPPPYAPGTTAVSTPTETVVTEAPKSVYAFNFAESARLMPLLEQAKAENKLVFVDFYTTWCAPCRLMEEQVFTDPGLASFMNKHFINYRVNGEFDNGPNLVSIFEVTSYPTLLFLNGSGQVVSRKNGIAMQTEFRQLAEQALAYK